MKKTVKPKLHLSRKSTEAQLLRPKAHAVGYILPVTTADNSESGRKHHGKFQPREPEPGEALPRTHNTLNDPGIYRPEAMVSLRPHADDFLQIKSLGAPT